MSKNTRKENPIPNAREIPPGKMRNLHERRSEATRARILEAAHMEFVANGLEGTRMETISTAAGVNKSLIYRHFNNKDFLYRKSSAAPMKRCAARKRNLICLPSRWQPWIQSSHSLCDITSNILIFWS